MDREQQRRLRKRDGHSNLQAFNYSFFHSSTSTLSDNPVELARSGFTSTSDVSHNDTTTCASRTDRRSLFTDLGLPAMFVIFPLTLLSAGLMGSVICGRHHIDQHSLFGPQLLPSTRSSNFVLVNISNSYLLSISSISSTVAGWMAPVIMMLQMYRNAQAFLIESARASHDPGSGLPTPYQLSLILGLCSGSLERLWRYQRYRTKTKSDIPKMMHDTAFVLKLSVLLSSLIIIADQCLHYTTTTVQISQASQMQELNAFGRGLTAECLSMKRVDNYYMPCSRDASLAAKNATEYIALQNQIFYLQHSTSDISNIATVFPDGEEPNSMALLLPHGVKASIDYRATTIGVSARCRPITSQCAMLSSGPSGEYTNFNCSQNFWGVLNKATLKGSNNTAVDPDVPPLALKWSRNLQYAFFSDSSLSVPYDTTGLDPTTGLGTDLTGLPDSQLVNPVHFAIAGSFSSEAHLAGANLNDDLNLYNGPGYYSFVLNCSYETAEVGYTTYQNRLMDFEIAPTKNGSIAEIYHGYQQSTSMGGADTELQDILATAALQSNSIDLANVWATMFSRQVLSVVGAFTSPRQNLQEQDRKSSLVTKLSIPALVVLLALNLAYLPLGLFLFVGAYQKASEIDIRDLFKRLSISGVVMSLFSTEASTSLRRSETCGSGFNEINVTQEGTRVEAVSNDEEGYRLLPVWYGS